MNTASTEQLQSVVPVATDSSEPALAKLVMIGSLPNNDTASNGSSRFIHCIANALCELGTDVTVLSQRSASRDPAAAYEQVPTWYSSQRSFFDIFMMLRRQKVRCVNLHHEVFLFGPLRVNAYLIVFLAVAKLTGFKIVTTMHHALDVDAIRLALSSEDHAHRAFTPLFELVSHLFNGLVAICSYRVTVHKIESLLAFHPIVRSRVSVIPLVIEKGRSEQSYEHRRALLAKYSLPERFLLAFGFVSKYKGLECLIEAYETKGTTLPLLIVGSKNIRLRERPDYRQYYDALQARALRAGVRWLDYLPEEDVGPLFAAATASVMPYLRHHAVSGPLAIAAAYDTPSIVSNVLGLEEFAGIDCAPEARALCAAIARVDSDPTYVARLRDAARRYAKNRSGQIVAQSYLALFE